MNLAYSVDKLYETGWQPDHHLTPESAGLERLPDGRLYPGLQRIQEIFASQDFQLVIRYVQLFDCYRAVWTDRTAAAQGAVVGSDEREAAVFALAQLRKAASVSAATSPGA